jgi:hypothetical protein
MLPDLDHPECTPDPAWRMDWLVDTAVVQVLVQPRLNDPLYGLESKATTELRLIDCMHDADEIDICAASASKYL